LIVIFWHRKEETAVIDRHVQRRVPLVYNDAQVAQAVIEFEAVFSKVSFDTLFDLVFNVSGDCGHVSFETCKAGIVISSNFSRREQVTALRVKKKKKPI
jgi:hypothetical protein